MALGRIFPVRVEAAVLQVARRLSGPIVPPRVSQAPRLIMNECVVQDVRAVRVAEVEMIPGGLFFPPVFAE
jgi:hypothetical protein